MKNNNNNMISFKKILFFILFLQFSKKIPKNSAKNFFNVPTITKNNFLKNPYYCKTNNFLPSTNSKINLNNQTRLQITKFVYIILYTIFILFLELIHLLLRHIQSIQAICMNTIISFIYLFY